jgi:hypothetical protein
MSWYSYDHCDISEFVGKTPTEIINGYDAIRFRMSDGSEYVMAHIQDCCENVSVEDIAGELNDLLDRPITVAEERSNFKETEYGDARWTFYELQGSRGYATIRWYGTSNGYYGTGVNIMRVSGPKVADEPSF